VIDLGSPWRVARVWHAPRGDLSFADPDGSCLASVDSPLAERQNGREGLVDPPLLVWGDPTHQIAKPPRVDRADLLN